ncbi:MAG TPA: DUF1015 domain-containing protein [Candidatus Acidoferrales bacterium]|nr:DUF1015 domain-containing protein [Candidatus Acidoferrales bacterium]
MAEIFPFRAYRYNPARVELASVVTQPYDKITPAMQERYYSLSPYNLITVEKGRPAPQDTPENNVYTRAAKAFEDWIAQGVLAHDPAPAIYAYSQDYALPHARERKVRRGFLALGRVEDYAAGIVFRHEQTLAGPKADRLELLRRTCAQTGQLFMLYADPERKVDTMLEQVSRLPTPIEVRDEYDVLHQLWPIVEGEPIERFRLQMADQKLVIADGHHRYETALAYRDECRATLGKVDLDAPHEKAMMTFFNTYGEGLTILPTHRVVSNLRDFQFERFRKQLEPYLDWYSYPFSSGQERATSYDEFRRDLERRGRDRRALGLYAGQGAFYLFLLRRNADLEALLPDVSPAKRQLDVVFLHRLVLEKGLGISTEAVLAEKHITYEREMDAAVAAVDHGQAQLCFLLNPVRIEQVMEIALGGEVLPQKSTDFYPKLLSGLTIYRLEP